MTAWTDDELRRVGDAEELQLGYPRTLNAIRVIDNVIPRSSGKEPS